MTPEEAGNIILEIFQKDCDKTKKTSSLTNNTVHKEYFRKTSSARGFFEGVNYLVQRKWITATEGQANTYEMTKAGRRAAV